MYLSLIPVIAGVALASASEVSFSMISLVSGLLSNVCFALRAISAKKLMNKPVRASAFLHSAETWRTMSFAQSLTTLLLLVASLFLTQVGENMNAQNLYAVLTMVALAGILPIALAAEGNTIWAGTLATIEQVGMGRFVRMLLMCGLSHYVYNEWYAAEQRAKAIENARSYVALHTACLLTHVPLSRTHAAPSSPSRRSTR